MKKFIFLLFLFASLNSYVYARNFAEDLAKIDQHIYQPRHYQFIIDQLKKYTTSTNEDEIVSVTLTAYSELKKEFPRITVHEVIQGILKTTETFYDQDRGKRQNIKNMATFYMTMKQLENRGL